MGSLWRAVDLCHTTISKCSHHLQRSSPRTPNGLSIRSPARIPTVSRPICGLYRRGAPVSNSLCRTFSTTASRLSWLLPKHGLKSKTRKGRPRVPTGGSSRGTTVVWGDWGLRLKDHHRRISSAQLATGAEAIKKRLRGQKFRLYTRVCANIPVYIKGSEVRMGKGKGSFDHWASRVAVSKIIFEVKGELHEKVVKDAFRLAAGKMPGLYEFARRGDPPVVGVTKLDGITLEELKRPRVPLPLEATADRLPAASAP